MSLSPLLPAILAKPHIRLDDSKISSSCIFVYYNLKNKVSVLSIAGACCPPPFCGPDGDSCLTAIHSTFCSFPLDLYSPPTSHTFSLMLIGYESILIFLLVSYYVFPFFQNPPKQNKTQTLCLILLFELHECSMK